MFYFLFLFCGCVLLAFGLFIFLYIIGEDELLDEFFAIDDFHEDLYTYISYARIIAGSLTILIGLFGVICCLKARTKGCVAVYSIYLLLLIGGEVASIVIPFMYKDNALDDREKKLQEDIKNNYSTSAVVKNEIDKLQRENTCCGALGIFITFVNTYYISWLYRAKVSFIFKIM